MINIEIFATNWRRWLLVIFVAAFGVRILATLVFEGLHDAPNPHAAGIDAVEFNAIAANLVAHQQYAINLGHPTSFRAPGFPFAVAIIYAITGVNNFLAAHIFFCLIGAALTIAVFLLARLVTDVITALIAATLTAFYPNILYYSIHFVSEPLFTLFLTLAIGCLVQALHSRSVVWHASSGFLLGLAALTRPLALYFFPFFALVALWFGRRQLKTTVLGVSAFVIALTIPIVPWSVRNYVVHERFLLLASNGGPAFWGSNNAVVLNNPAYHGQWVTDNMMMDQKSAVLKFPNEVDRDRLEMQLGKRFLREHLSDVPRLVWYKFIKFWTPFCQTPNKKFNLIVGVSYGALIPFMACGFWFFVQKTKRTLTDSVLLTLPIITTVLGTLAFYGSNRFRSTIEPILLIFAAVAFTRILAMLFPSGSHTHSPPLVAPPNPPQLFQ